MSHVYPGSGLTHFWPLPDMQRGDSSEFLDGQPAAETEITDGLMLLARKLVIDISVPQSAHDLQAIINTKSEYFQELCHVCEQVIDYQKSLKRWHASKVTAYCGR